VKEVNEQNGTHLQKVSQGMPQLPEKRKEKKLKLITYLFLIPGCIYYNKT